MKFVDGVGKHGEESGEVVLGASSGKIELTDNIT